MFIESVRRNFQHRRVLSPTELHSEFALADAVSAQDLARALSIFDEAYGVKAGLLRADDTLETFTVFPGERNPFTWLFCRFQYEDRLGDLNVHLGIGRARTGASRLAQWPSTVREYVLEWSGANPPPPVIR